jgi:hypothetical protein
MPRLAAPRRYYRALVIVVAGALAATASLVLGPEMGPLDGLIYDFSLMVTAKRPGSTGEPAAIIALDDESLASPCSRRSGANWSTV